MELKKGGPCDAAAIAALRHAVADDLTRRFGRGHWSGSVSERGVLFGMQQGRVLVALEKGELVGVLRLARRKPWAIDPEYFTPLASPLYLTDMAVHPAHQGEGIGRWLLGQAVEVAMEWPADGIRLDAYDADAGGGGFYLHCGFQEVGRVTYRNTPLIYFQKVLSDQSP